MGLSKAKISVRVRVGARREEVAGVVDGCFSYCVSAPARGGRANHALCGLLAKRLRVSSCRAW